MNKGQPRWIEPQRVGDKGTTTRVPIQPSLSSNISFVCPSDLQNQTMLYHGSDIGATSSFSGAAAPNHGSSPDSSNSGVLHEFSSAEANGMGTNRRVQRQSHTKSRTGCFNCKKRRIKCPENHPACTQCTKHRLQCEWPDVQIRDAGGALLRASPTPSVQNPLRTPESSFSMEDFRLFYHFIQTAYPHHPLGNEAVWKHDIASISHNHTYLMHAMLGLSASDLAMQPEEKSKFAWKGMSHRVVAIKALNEALSRGLHTVEEGNAILATCFVLLFQSVLLEDGLPEYMFFIRGCSVVAMEMGCKGLKFLFHSFLGMDQLAKMGPHLEGSPGLSTGPLDAARMSLDAFEPLCTQEHEKHFHGCLVKTVKALYSSSREAYLGLMDMYQAFSFKMTHDEFQSFVDPMNEVAQLLQSHFVAVQFLLTPITVNELGDRKPSEPSYESSRWLKAIHSRIQPPMRKYYAWPIAVDESLKDLSFFKELSGWSPSTLQDDESDNRGSSEEQAVHESTSIED